MPTSWRSRTDILAGLGIAFHAKPKVKATARQSISTIGLDGILYFLGLKDSRIEA